MEAIRSLHRQLDDDDNGNIDLSESDDVSFNLSIVINNFHFFIVVSFYYCFACRFGWLFY